MTEVLANLVNPAGDVEVCDFVGREVGTENIWTMMTGEPLAEFHHVQRVKANGL